MSEHQAPSATDTDTDATADSNAAAYSDALERIAGDLEGVEAAMARLEDGTYGSCSICGRKIDDETLSRDPLATTCAEHG